MGNKVETAKAYPCRAHRWHQIPASMRRIGTALLDQQLWCWGYDIRVPTTNLLLDYGFNRLPVPQEVVGSTIYSYRDSKGCEFVLCGYGIFYRQARLGGIFLRRFDFAPKLISTELDLNQLWAIRNLCKLKIAHTPAEWQLVLELLADLLNWIITYEQWVLSHNGVAYRDEAIRLWLRPFRNATEAILEWQNLASQANELAQTFNIDNSYPELQLDCSLRNIKLVG